MDNISSIGHTWEEVRNRIFTPEEMAASNLRVALIGELVKARQEMGITQESSNNTAYIAENKVK